MEMCCSNETVESVWRNIKFWIAWVGLKLKEGSKMGPGDEFILNSLKIPMKPLKNKNVHMVKWLRPKVGAFKRNVDGSSVGHPGRCGSGGVIRNFRGKLQLAFAVSLGQGTNNFAELCSLLHGLWCIAQLGISNLEIELDSLLIVNWLKQGLCGLWYLFNYWEEIQRYLAEMFVTIQHVYRECNAAANFLALLGAEGTNKNWHQYMELPHRLRGILKIDKVGLPALRC